MSTTGRPARRPDGAVLLDLVVAAGLAALAGGAMAPVFGGLDPLMLPVGVAAGLAVITSGLLTTLLGSRPLVVGLVTPPALLVGAVAACGASPADVVSGLTDGYLHLLHSPLPVGAPDAELLVVPFVLTALAALGGAAAAQRSSSLVAPVLPSLVALGVALASGLDGLRLGQADPATDLPPVGLTVGWLALAGWGIGWRRSRLARQTGVEAAPRPAATATARGSRSLAGALVAVVVVVVPVAGVARALGPSLPGLEDRDRFSFRDWVTPAPSTGGAAELNPLAAMTAYQAGEDQVLFRAETTGRVERWRLAVLDDYGTGVEWTGAGRFAEVGGELPRLPVAERPSPAPPTVAVDQRIEVAGLRGRWLPVADRAVELSLDDLAFDTVTGVVRTVDAEMPVSYEVASEVVAFDAETLSGAAVATDAAAREALALPDTLPEELVALAQAAVPAGGSGYARASALAAYLADQNRAAPFVLAGESIPGGHSLAQLRCFVADEPRCGRRGSTEQFVALFAVLARQAGLPARIVVGFQGAGIAGSDEVTSHEATAWAEVRLAGVGWVPFDPVPRPDVTTQVSTPPPGAATGDGQPAPPSSAPTEAAAAEGDEAEQQDGPAQDGGTDGLVVALGTAGTLLALVVTMPALLRARRRRRWRRGPGPVDQVVGAWKATIAEIALAGIPVRRDQSVSDLVAVGRSRLDTAAAEPLGPLGALVNQALFGAVPPDDRVARQAWAFADRLARQRRRGRSPAQRLREHFQLRTPVL